jgi:hypothetical protein
MRLRIQLLALLERFNWELFDHPYYSRDIASSDYKLVRSQRSSNKGNGSSSGDYVEKQPKCERIFISSFFLVACYVNRSAKVNFRVALVLLVLSTQGGEIGADM